MRRRPSPDTPCRTRPPRSVLAPCSALAPLALLALLAVLLPACAALPGGTRAPEAGGLTVVTYNIRAGQDTARLPNLERVAALLDTLGADVALLQEVDRGTRRSGRVDQVAELERLTGMAALFGKSMDYDGGDYGIALLTRLPIREHAVVRLTPPPVEGEESSEPRVALYALLETPAGALPVLNTHLDAGEGTHRRQEMLTLLATIQRRAGGHGPLVVGGDLNARPESAELAAATLVLDDAWPRCGAGDGLTFPAHAPDRRIDYVLLRGLECAGARVHPSTASDHRPLAVEVAWPGAR
ncbi:MAG TPA: endonuclease/exonuclease/phosphatase family protein [Longimicrobiales bacterium]|nr:endonuclease/exonuclease/phosphatase family protein [Longimicrobiales bacterium]